MGELLNVRTRSRLPDYLTGGFVPYRASQCSAFVEMDDGSTSIYQNSFGSESFRCEFINGFVNGVDREFEYEYDYSNHSAHEVMEHGAGA